MVFFKNMTYFIFIYDDYIDSVLTFSITGFYKEKFTLR